MDFIKSATNKEKKSLIYDGFVYRIDRVLKSTDISWYRIFLLPILNINMPVLNQTSLLVNKGKHTIMLANMC